MRSVTDESLQVIYFAEEVAQRSMYHGYGMVLFMLRSASHRIFASRLLDLTQASNESNTSITEALASIKTVEAFHSAKSVRFRPRENNKEVVQCRIDKSSCNWISPGGERNEHLAFLADWLRECLR